MGSANGYLRRFWVAFVGCTAGYWTGACVSHLTGAPIGVTGAPLLCAGGIAASLPWRDIALSSLRTCTGRKPPFGFTVWEASATLTMPAVAFTAGQFPMTFPEHSRSSREKIQTVRVPLDEAADLADELCGGIRISIIYGLRKVSGRGFTVRYYITVRGLTIDDACTGLGHVLAIAQLGQWKPSGQGTFRLRGGELYEVPVNPQLAPCVPYRGRGGAIAK